MASVPVPAALLLRLLALGVFRGRTPSALKDGSAIRKELEWMSEPPSPDLLNPDGSPPQAWDDALIARLEADPKRSSLTLIDHQQAFLALGRTYLTHLSVDVTGLRRLVLPRTLTTLELVGRATNLLWVSAHESGRWLWLWVHGEVPRLRGLKSLRGLRIEGSPVVDPASLLEQFPALVQLQLPGDADGAGDSWDLPACRSIVP